ncbi:MAG TPA: NAD(+) synthase [Bacilli bacterium]|nr:NAD(+) synthase [Bacilli bacterium]
MYSQGFLKVAAACPTARVGDVMFNVKQMLTMLQEATSKDPAIICFPELCITGYSVGDLVFQKYLYDDSLKAINYLLEHNPFAGVIIFGSFIIINDTIYNCGFVAQKNRVLGIVPKNFLPHTNEFYEARWFASGAIISKDVQSVELLGQKIPFGKIIFVNDTKEVSFGAEICADMWAPISPNERLYGNGAIIVFNASASPAHVGKRYKRQILTQSMSLKFNGAYVYVSNNASESSSEAVFSSHKLIAENGIIVAEDDDISLHSSIIYGDINILKLHFLRRNNCYYKSIQDSVRDPSISFVSFDLQRSDTFIFEKEIEKYPFVPKHIDDFEDIINIQAASIVKRLDYVGVTKTIIGVSGGLDSTLALLSLCYAYDRYQLKRQDIIAVRMPSKENSPTSNQNAQELVDKLGVTSLVIPIQEDVNRQLAILKHDLENKDTTYENVQARFRTYTLMNLANHHKGLVVGTSDMSEIALGWSTFNGDHMAMYGLNAGITKTVVIETVRFYKTIFPEVRKILDLIIDAPISPELSGSKQRTEDVIGKFAINDFILYHFLVYGDDAERISFLLTKAFQMDIKKAQAAVDNFNKRFYSQQYKRLTMPEGAKVLGISLSPRTELKLNGDIYRIKVEE